MPFTLASDRVYPHLPVSRKTVSFKKRHFTRSLKASLQDDLFSVVLSVALRPPDFLWYLLHPKSRLSSLFFQQSDSLSFPKKNYKINGYKITNPGHAKGFLGLLFLIVWFKQQLCGGDVLFSPLRLQQLALLASIGYVSSVHKKQAFLLYGQGFRLVQ